MIAASPCGKLSGCGSRWRLYTKLRKKSAKMEGLKHTQRQTLLQQVATQQHNTRRLLIHFLKAFKFNITVPSRAQIVVSGHCLPGSEANFHKTMSWCIIGQNHKSLNWVFKENSSITPIIFSAQLNMSGLFESCF